MSRMAMTRSDFVTEICDVVGKSVSASSVSGAALQDRVVTYLDWAQKRIARAHSFHELNSLKANAETVADVKRYPLTAGDNNLGLTRVKDILSIRLDDSTNSRLIRRWHYRKFDRWFPRPEQYTTGRPRIYTRRGNFLELYRIPNDAYTLKITYAQWAQDFASASQTSDFENKDQLVFTGGVLETYLALEEYTDAKIWFDRFRGLLYDSIKVEADIDWEPEAEGFGEVPSYTTGTPYSDPYGETGDALYGYPE